MQSNLIVELQRAGHVPLQPSPTSFCLLVACRPFLQCPGTIWQPVVLYQAASSELTATVTNRLMLHDPFIQARTHSVRGSYVLSSISRKDEIGSILHADVVETFVQEWDA